MKISDPNIAFFGGEPLGVPTLKELAIADIQPDLIVCNPDRPAGRGQKLTTPPVKNWATENNIKVFQPTSYKDDATRAKFNDQEWDLFIVVAYNFILPQWLLDIPTHGVINVHPSLLPQLRGASPIRTAIRDDLIEAIGATVMLMDEKMDHGPILQQQSMKIDQETWPIPGPELDKILAQRGGALLADTIPRFLAGEITPIEQDHDAATYCGRFEKADAEIALDPNNLPNGEEAQAVLRHIYAWQGIGDAFFTYDEIRIKIKQAELTSQGQLRLLRVIPAGKAEINFEQFLQSIS